MTPSLTSAIVAAIVTLCIAMPIMRRRFYRRGFDEGRVNGYQQMRAVHEQYRSDNRAVLAGLQNVNALPMGSGLTIVFRHLDNALETLSEPGKANTARQSITLPDVDHAIGSLNAPAVLAVRDHFKIPRHPSARYLTTDANAGFVCKACDMPLAGMCVHEGCPRKGFAIELPFVRPMGVPNEPSLVKQPSGSASICRRCESVMHGLRCLSCGDFDPAKAPLEHPDPSDTNSK
jgi:hypothetical protein